MPSVGQLSAEGVSGGRHAHPHSGWHEFHGLCRVGAHLAVPVPVAKHAHLSAIQLAFLPSKVFSQWEPQMRWTAGQALGDFSHFHTLNSSPA